MDPPLYTVPFSMGKATCLQGNLSENRVASTGEQGPWLSLPHSLHSSPGEAKSKECRELRGHALRDKTGLLQIYKTNHCF